MTAITRNPSNPNFLQPNKFILTFSRLPNIQYFCQTVTVPGISMSEIPQFTPFVDAYLPGEKAIYDLLNITFMIDENITSWKEVHDWIRAMTFPENFEEYKNLTNLNPNRSQRLKPQYSDAKIVLLSSSNNPKIEFNFYDVFPTSLSTIIMSAQETPDNVITADATFRYTYYDIKYV
jgi:hypothetical protein